MERDIVSESNVSKNGIIQMWSEDEVVSRHFPYRSILEKLLTDVHRVMLKINERHPYNSFSSMVRFYQEYKQQDRPLQEFFEQHYKITIAKDSQCCIGKAIYLRRKLIKHISNEHSNLEKNLCLVTGNPYQVEVIPERFQMGPPEETGYLKDHSLLVMKFTLESKRRPGFIIMDHGFLNDFPIVVMEDSEPPHTGSFTFISRNGDRTYNFQYYNENYIHWTSIIKTSDNVEKIVHDWFFVGKRLTNILQIEKRNLLNAFHALAFGGIGGPMASAFSILGKCDYFQVSLRVEELSTEDHESKQEFQMLRIPLSYFFKEKPVPRNDEWEYALNVLESKYPYGRLRDLFQDFAQLANDEEFVSSLSKIDDNWKEKIEHSLDC